MLIREKLENSDFSNTEQTVVDYVLEHTLEIENMTIKEIAQICYTVPSTLVRISHKMDYKGWSELKKALVEEEKYLQSYFFNVDANLPFNENDTIMSISNKIATLKKESIDDTLSLLDHDNLQKAVNLLNEKQFIHIFSVSQNPLLVSKFGYDMMRLHKDVIIHNQQYDFTYESYLINQDACALLISYTGITPVICECAQILKDHNVPIIGMTSIGDNRLSLLSDCVLRLSTRERLYSKINSYSTDESIIYLLELLYSCLFKLNYRQNFEEKIRLSQLTDTRKYIKNKIIKEEK